MPRTTGLNEDRIVGGGAVTIDENVYAALRKVADVADSEFRGMCKDCEYYGIFRRPNGRYCAAFREDRCQHAALRAALEALAEIG